MTKPPRSPPPSSSIDPNSGFCSETKIYHSPRPSVPLPFHTTPLSITDYIFSLFPPPTTTAAAAVRHSLIDADVNSDAVSRTQLLHYVSNLTAFLQTRIGLSKGDCAFVLSPNSVHVPVLYLSLFSIGVIVSPSNPVGSVPEISRQIRISKPVIAFTVSDTVHKLPVLRHPPVLVDSAEFTSMLTNDLHSTIPRPIKVVLSDTSTILYSSGTTGRVKGVKLSHLNFVSAIEMVRSVRPVRLKPAVTLCTVPYFHVYGLNLCLREVAFGGTLVSMRKFELELMIRVIENLRVTHLALAPPVLAAMVNEFEVISRFDVSSLEVVMCGGAPLANALVDKFRHRFPAVSIAQAYGLTETTGGITRTIGVDECKVRGASGRLLSNCQAKIVDPETGASLPPYKVGELRFSGPLTMKGYVDDEEANAGIFDSEGWLKSGDLCYFDGEGFLFCVDRIKDVIKYKGYPIAPAELEDVVQSHPEVVHAAVVPCPDEEAGQVPVAFVVRRSASDVTESQLKDFVTKQVSPYKKLRRIVFVHSLPKNSAGKVLRKDLMKLAASGTSSKL